MWSFSHPVCLAQGIEMIWTPAPREEGAKQLQNHLMESIWFACGSSGIKVHQSCDYHMTIM